MVGILGGCEALTPIEEEGDPVIRIINFQSDLGRIASSENQIIADQTDDVTVIVT